MSDDKKILLPLHRIYESANEHLNAMMDAIPEGYTLTLIVRNKADNKASLVISELQKFALDKEAIDLSQDLKYEP